MKNAEVKTLEKRSFPRVFFNLGLFQFLSFLRRGVFYSFMINYLYMLMQATVTSTAMLGTLNMIASSLGQNLLWGRISDRFNLRTKLIIVGETIAGFSYLIVFFIHKSLMGVGNNFAAGLAIIFGLSVLEFFWSMSDVGWTALLTDVTTIKTRGRIIGTLNFVASFGRMVGILFAGFLYADGEGFKNGTIFYIVTTLLFVGAAIMAMTSRRMKVKRLQQKELITEKKDKQESKAAGENERRYRWFLVSLIIIILGIAAINQVFLLFIKLPEGLNASDSEMSFILSAWTIGGMFASLATGRLADKIGRIKVMFGGLSLAVITPILYGFASNVLFMALVYGLNGVAFWTSQTAGFAIAGDIIPAHKRGRLLSRYNAVVALSWGPAGILIGGPLADVQVKILGLPVYSAFVNVFFVSSIMVTLGMILFASKVARTKTEV